MYSEREQELFSVPVPERTRSYSPIPHKAIVDMLNEELTGAGFEITERKYVANKGAQMLNGTFITSYEKDPELQLSFSFTNSYNKFLKAGIVGGAYQKICKNGMFGSSVRFVRKHTGGVFQELYEALQRCIESGEKQMNDLIYIKNRLKETQITKRTCSELLGRMFIEEALITSTQLNIVKRELESPSFAYDFQDTAFELFSHLTHAYKEDHPLFYMKRHINTLDFFKEEFNIQLSEYKQVSLFNGNGTPFDEPLTAISDVQEQNSFVEVSEETDTF